MCSGRIWAGRRRSRRHKPFTERFASFYTSRMSCFLIADDSSDKISFLKQMLSRAAWEGEVLVAMTTEDAKTLIDAHSDITAAFVDYYMPSENGSAVIKYMKATAPRAHVALVSSSDSKANALEASAAGAEATVCTSYRQDEVERRLLDLLEEWKAT